MGYLEDLKSFCKQNLTNNEFQSLSSLIEGYINNLKANFSSANLSAYFNDFLLTESKLIKKLVNAKSEYSNLLLKNINLMYSSEYSDAEPQIDPSLKMYFSQDRKPSPNLVISKLIYQNIKNLCKEWMSSVPQTFSEQLRNKDVTLNSEKFRQVIMRDNTKYFSGILLRNNGYPKKFSDIKIVSNLPPLLTLSMITEEIINNSIEAVMEQSYSFFYNFLLNSDVINDEIFHNLTRKYLVKSCLAALDLGIFYQNYESLEADIMGFEGLITTTILSEFFEQIYPSIESVSEEKAQEIMGEISIIKGVLGDVKSLLNDSMKFEDFELNKERFNNIFGKGIPLFNLDFKKDKEEGNLINAIMNYNKEVIPFEYTPRDETLALVSEKMKVGEKMKGQFGTPRPYNVITTLATIIDYVSSVFSINILRHTKMIKSRLGV